MYDSPIKVYFACYNETRMSMDDPICLDICNMCQVSSYYLDFIYAY
jgi:hypothetical protein